MSIKVNNIFYTYSKSTLNKSDALKGLSLEINNGGFNAILGKTGSGKSTLIQTLNALIVPDKGNVEVDNFVIQKKKRFDVKKLRKHVGVVFQFPEYQLFEETVEKDVAFGLINYGLKEKDALNIAHNTLISLGLDDRYFKRSPFELSGGEKRRVAIAGILCFDPDIIVLDEPTAGLDAKARSKLIAMLVNLNKMGKTIIVVTHDMDLVLECANNVYVIKDGVLAFTGTPYELFKEDRTSFDIEIPELFKFAVELNKNGFDINLDNIRNVDDLATAIAERRRLK